jgi:hypothetical protein
LIIAPGPFQSVTAVAPPIMPPAVALRRLRFRKTQQICNDVNLLEIGMFSGSLPNNRPVCGEQ